MEKLKQNAEQYGVHEGSQVADMLKVASSTSAISCYALNFCQRQIGNANLAIVSDRPLFYQCKNCHLQFIFCQSYSLHLQSAHN